MRTFFVCTPLVLLFLTLSCAGPERRNPAAGLFPTSCQELASLFLKSNEKGQQLSEFKLIHSEFDVTTPAQNRAFKMIATNPKPDRRLYYFHLANGVLKLLNDKVLKDKDLSQAVTIYYQRLFKKHLQENEFLAARAVLEYTDYKSYRIALTSLSANDEKLVFMHLDKVFRKVNDDFGKKMTALGLDEELKQAPYLAQDSRRWFIAGFGHTAEEAGITFRVTRDRIRKIIPTLSTYSEFREILAERLQFAEKFRLQIVERFDDVPNLLTVVNDKQRKVLSAEFNDLYRKHDFADDLEYKNFLPKLQEIFKRRFSMEEMKLLVEYARVADLFSPEIFQIETVAFDFSRAVKGVLSFDFAQKGAEGMVYTMAQMSSQDIATALVNIRQSYFKVDYSIKDSMQRLFKILRPRGPPFQEKQFILSGDEMLLFPQQAFTIDKKINMVSKISRSENPSEYRIVFLPSNYIASGKAIPADSMSAFVIMGENLEKTLRYDLKQKFSVNEAKQLTIAVDIMPIDQRSTRIDLIISGVASDDLQDYLKQAFSDYLSRHQEDAVGDIIFN